VLIGAYGVPEVLNAVRKCERMVIQTEVGRVVPRFREVLKHRWIILRSSFIGLIIGIVPGVGSDTASWLSYFTARSGKASNYSAGSVEGLIARQRRQRLTGETSSPLTLAIPGSAPAAVLLAAMTIHNLRPGPMLVVEQPQVVGQIIAISMVATLAVFVLSLLWVRQMVRLLLIPRDVLMPAVFVICVTGAYALSGRLFDIYVMFAFGLIGVLMQELDYPVGPFVLGFILGPMAEDNLRRGLVITAGDPTPFFTRPISFILFTLLVASIVGSTGVGRRIGEKAASLWSGKNRVRSAR
jgi:putative tricarboxylic transport membrane protein